MIFFNLWFNKKVVRIVVCHAWIVSIKETVTICYDNWTVFYEGRKDFILQIGQLNKKARSARELVLIFIFLLRLSPH